MAGLGLMMVPASGARASVCTPTTFSEKPALTLNRAFLIRSWGKSSFSELLTISSLSSKIYSSVLKCQVSGIMYLAPKYFHKFEKPGAFPWGFREEHGEVTTPTFLPPWHRKESDPQFSLAPKTGNLFWLTPHDSTDQTYKVDLLYILSLLYILICSWKIVALNAY